MTYQRIHVEFTLRGRHTSFHFRVSATNDQEDSPLSLKLMLSWAREAAREAVKDASLDPAKIAHQLAQTLHDSDSYRTWVVRVGSGEGEFTWWDEVTIIADEEPLTSNYEREDEDVPF